jgi:hypothetical protein
MDIVADILSQKPEKRKNQRFLRLLTGQKTWIVKEIITTFFTRSILPVPIQKQLSKGILNSDGRGGRCRGSSDAAWDLMARGRSGGRGAALPAEALVAKMINYSAKSRHIFPAVGNTITLWVYNSVEGRGRR